MPDIGDPCRWFPGPKCTPACDEKFCDAAKQPLGGPPPAEDYRPVIKMESPSRGEHWPPDVPTIPWPPKVVRPPERVEVEDVEDVEHDEVNHPKHYTAHPSGVECIEITRHMGFNLGNAIKYVWRADMKDDAIKDMKKAIWYIKDEIRKRGGDPEK